MLISTDSYKENFHVKGKKILCFRKCKVVPEGRRRMKGRAGQGREFCGSGKVLRILALTFSVPRRSSGSGSLCHNHRRSAFTLQSLTKQLPAAYCSRESEVMLPMKLEVYNCDCSTAWSRDGQPAFGHLRIARAHKKTT